MTSHPDTLLTAAKKVALATRLPWATVQKIYSSLQEADVLPLSQGRRIWLAQPNLVADLCMGLAFRSSGSAIPDLVKYFEQSTLGGVGWQADSLLFRLASFLADPNSANGLVRVVFEMDLLSAKVVCQEGEREVVSEYFHEQRENKIGDSKDPPLITTRGVIDGALFRILSSEIVWGANLPPTYGAQIESPAE